MQKKKTKHYNEPYFGCYLMTQVTVTLTEDESHKSRSNVKKIAKKLNPWPYLISYFTNRLHTSYQDKTQCGAFYDPGDGDFD